MRGGDQHPKEDELKETIIKTNIVFESISRSSVLAELILFNVIFEEDCPLEGFLSSTRTLLELAIFQNYSTMTLWNLYSISSSLATDHLEIRNSWFWWTDCLISGFCLCHGDSFQNEC
jgi:hypothetical protein